MYYVIASSLLVVASAAAIPQSEFAQYPSEARSYSTPAAPVLDTPDVRRFRTLLRDASAKGPNFNGHFRVVTWGCGSNCQAWAVVNLTDGKVWMPPGVLGSCWPRKAPKVAVPDWIESHVGSRLLYVYECVDPTRDDVTFDTRHVFEWTAAGPKVLRIDKVEY